MNYYKISKDIRGIVIDDSVEVGMLAIPPSIIRECETEKGFMPISCLIDRQPSLNTSELYPLAIILSNDGAVRINPKTLEDVRLKHQMDFSGDVVSLILIDTPVDKVTEVADAT